MDLGQPQRFGVPAGLARLPPDVSRLDHAAEMTKPLGDARRPQGVAGARFIRIEDMR
jgi:hypothetical protein